MPILGQQDRHFPVIEKLCYDNYLEAVYEIPGDFQYQFTLKDGANCGTKGSKVNWRRIYVNQTQVLLSKIEIGYLPTSYSIVGLKFYSKDNAVVRQTGWNWAADSRFKTHTVHLEDGERVIGYKSRTCPRYPNKAKHRDLQLIIGRFV